jgi:hypothetical protein
MSKELGLRGGCRERPDGPVRARAESFTGPGGHGQERGIGMMRTVAGFCGWRDADRYGRGGGRRLFGILPANEGAGGEGERGVREAAESEFFI